MLKLGDHLYYSAIAKDNPGKVRALVNTTRESLSPYYSFLDEAIKAENKRGSFEINWEEVRSEVVLRVNPRFQKIKLVKPQPQILIDITGIDIEEGKNRLIYDMQDEMFSFHKDDVDINNTNSELIYTPELMPEMHEKLELNKKEVSYKIVNVTLNNQSKLEDEKGKIIDIHDLEEITDGWNITVEASTRIEHLSLNGLKLKALVYDIESFEVLYDADKKMNFAKIGSELHVDQEPISKFLISEKKVEYTWYKIKNKKKEYAIQLIDDDRLDTEKLISEHFFDDGVRAIYQGKDKRNQIDIKHKNADEKILILKSNSRNPIELTKNEPIKIAVNITTLRRQKDAVKYLNDTPVKNQKNLIKLFEKKHSSLWSRGSTKEIRDWYVLKDESYDGTLSQRRFVIKALSTDDFAFLEGPPGSGKTTAIIELILQLVKTGKKILLSASTHVAIDNVLERIKSYDTDDLVEPLRIGDSSRIDEAVVCYQIDEKIERYRKKGVSEDLARKIVLDGANLVCGTTMGIQQHPYIKERGHNSDLPINPIYDYMIIDESSKTTFQEFLVPALQAKKWVLVGDIKQLSPFIEQEHIIHNFNFLVDDYTQRAIRIAFEALNNNANPYVIEVDLPVIDYITKYLDYWDEVSDNPYRGKIVNIIIQPLNDDIYLANNLFNLLGSDLILMQTGIWEKIKQYIPKTHIVILKKPDKFEPFYYQQLYLNQQKRLPKYSKINKNTIKDNNPVAAGDLFSEMLKERSWAEEISWRMIRVYERRMLKNPNSYYERTFDLLKPIGKDNVVDRIYNMTLPSILESLQTGNGEKHRNETTITDGFEKNELRPRHEMLDYQHRMHSEISAFSREEFYTTEERVALKDGKNTDRIWDFDHYNHRAIWIDVPKKDKNQDNIHQAEVDRIIKELNVFIQYAIANPHPEGREWSVAIITFYRPQETLLRIALRKYCNLPNKMSRFNKEGIQILNYTVDKFQGMEADIVFLSMVRGKTIGFLDNINRLNVALTRARFQRVILGDINFFRHQRNSDELKRLAEKSEVVK